MDDDQLLDAWRGGDLEAGETLFERYFSSLYRFFGNKVQDHVDDLVQDTFLKSVQSKERVTEAAAFRGYLFSIARNVLFSHLRRRRRDKTDLDFSLTSLADVGVSPTRRIAAGRERKLLGEALRQIPLDLQIALELYYWEGFRGPEIARVLGVPEGTARSRIRRGIEQLREVMGALESSPHADESLEGTLTGWAEELRERWPEP